MIELPDFWTYLSRYSRGELEMDDDLFAEVTRLQRNARARQIHEEIEAARRQRFHEQRPTTEEES